MISDIITRFLKKWIASHDFPDGRKLRLWYKKHKGIELGKYTYGDFNTIASGTKIGSFCSIGPNVKIGQMNHPLEYVSTNPFLYYKSRGFLEEDKKIFQKTAPVIDDDVWIGANAIILPGVHIGKGAVIGAGAVVTKDVKPYACMGGGPAKLLKFRFNEDIIAQLLKIDWCSMSDDWIRNNIDSFYDVEKFIERVKEDTEQ